VTQKTDAATETILAAAIEVHRSLGPGLLESAYDDCLAIELTQRAVPFLRQVPLLIVYKSVRLTHRVYRMDFVVDSAVVVEIKAQERMSEIGPSQLLTYLRLGGYSRGLLLNFGARRLVDGIERVVNNWSG
jgi:GxxExxY protein